MALWTAHSRGLAPHHHHHHAPEWSITWFPQNETPRRTMSRRATSCVAKICRLHWFQGFRGVWSLLPPFRRSVCSVWFDVRLS